jgi:hypothetical protein
MGEVFDIEKSESRHLRRKGTTLLAAREVLATTPRHLLGATTALRGKDLRGEAQSPLDSRAAVTG